MKVEARVCLLSLFLAPALFAQAIDSTKVLETTPGRGSVATTQAVLNRAAFSYDVGYDTLAHACEVARSSGRTLVISKAWMNVSSLECPANLAFFGGGMIQIGRA